MKKMNIEDISGVDNILQTCDYLLDKADDMMYTEEEKKRVENTRQRMRYGNRVLEMCDNILFTEEQKKLLEKKRQKIKQERLRERQSFLDGLINTGAYKEHAKKGHDVWIATKESQGWKYGPERDNANKINPYMVPLEELSPEMQGQSSLTPYAVINYYRIQMGTDEFYNLSKKIKADLEDPAELDKIGEYVHSHFLAAQLAKGETIETRDDMIVYEDLSDEVKSWDIELAKGAMKWILEKHEAAWKQLREERDRDLFKKFGLEYPEGGVNYDNDRREK